MMQMDRVRALLGNLKNWSWDIAPQYRIEKEEATALLEFLKDNPEVGHICRINKRCDEEN